MVGGHVTEPSVRRALALVLALLLVAVGLIAGMPSAQAVVPTSVQTFQGRFGSYNASTSFMTGACSVATSSTINLPAAPVGATIDTAYLLWAASGNTADTTATLNGTPVSGVAVTDFFDPTEGYFQTRANITSLVTTAGGVFTIGGITSATGAPWCTYSTVMKSATIYVFYEDPSEPVSQLNFYSGLEIVYGSESTVNVSHGPLAPGATGEVEVLLYEGDAGLSGSRNGFRERFRVNGTVTSSGNNQWNSSTGIAIDMDTMAVPGGALTVGATSTQIRMSSGNDFVLLSSFVLESQIQAADIAVTKAVDNVQPDPGDTITYTVAATNNGVDTSTGVQITDMVPPGLTFASAAATQGTYTSGTGVWDVGTLANGAFETLTITATVDAGTVGNTIVNTATKTGGSGFDVDASNDTSTATLTVRGADLEVTKTVDNTTPNPGSTITYTVTVANNGPTTTTGVAITDTLPGGLTLVSSSATTGSYVGSTWTVGALASGGSATLTIVANVDAGTAGSNITNTASVTNNDLVDPIASNNSDSIQVRVPLVDIGVAKAAGNATPLPGDTYTYTVTATNNGPDGATGVTVDDAIPAGVTLTGVSATAGSYAADTWSIGPLASGATETITFTVSVPTGSTGGTVTNTAAVSGVNETESTTANNSASATVTIAQSDIAVTKTVDVAAPNPGETIAYTVTVVNNGPDTATGVLVTDALPTGVTETGSSATQGSYTDPTWTVGTLASGASATLTVTATVDAGTAGTTQTNTATGSSDQADPDPSNNGVGADILIPAVDVALTKTVNNSAPNPSDTITYTVSVTNNGPDTATAVAIADTVPSGVTLVSASPSQGSYASGIWTVGTIPNGGSETLTIVATVDAGTAGSTITNTASLLSVTETDMDSSNDADNAAIGVPAVDLAVTKTVSAPNPNPGQTVTYTVTVTNNGPDAATGITITDNVPAGLVVTGSSASQGGFAGSAWSVGGLASGATETLTITAIIGASTVGTTITNTAAVAAVTETDIDLTNDSDTASFAVPAVDLAVTKAVSDPVPNPGDTVTYVITVTNNGPDIATGISLSDALPSEVSLDTASATQGSYVSPIWTVGSLASGASATLTVTATVLPSAAGVTVTNTASLSSVDQTDTDALNNSSSASLAAPAIDLAITKTVDLPLANPGDTVTYTVVVTNNGPDNATGVTITDSLPAGVTLVSAFTTAGSYSAPTWTVGSLPSGLSETLTITATIDAGTAGTTITNTASVAASVETDINPSNDGNSATVVVPSADLSVVKFVDDANPLPGDTVTFTISVTNIGPSAATGISISDPLPAGLTLVSATPSQGSYTDPAWSVGGLGNGASATLTIVATVNAGTPGTSISNIASVAAFNETDPDSSNNSATSTIYVSAVDLAVTKTATTALAQVGDAVSYTVTVTNNGPDAASGVTINDSVPSGVTLVSASFSQGSYAAGVWTVGTLANGATETLTLNVTVDPASAGSIVTNTASVGAVDETDTDPANDSDSAAFGVLAVDIDVTKTVDNPTPVPGATVTYTVTVNNAGPSPASGVTITDALPTGVTSVSATPSQGSYVGSSWTIGTLGIAGSAMLTIVATVDLGTAGTTIINTASVTGVNEYDLDAANDADSAAIVVSAVDLSVTKTVDDTAPNPGDTITFTVAVTNAGPEVATGVSLTDALPAGVTLVSATPSQGSVFGSTWTVGSLAVAISATLTIVATVDAGTAGTAITNTATVASVDQIDVDPTNDSATATMNVPLTDVAVAKSVDNATPNPGDTITYTISVTNPSVDDATGVVVADSLPAGVTMSSASASQGTYVASTWTVGPVGAGASATLTIVATIDAGTAGSTISNTASVTNVNETESNLANNTSTADFTVNAVDLEATKTVDNATPNPGNTIVYTISVSNTGPSTATGVTLVDSLPFGVTLVSASASQGSYIGSTWAIGTITNGATATLTLTATVDAGTAGSTIPNTASIGLVNETDTDLSNDSDTVAVVVQAIDLAVGKGVDNGAPVEGETVTYTVVVTNNGPNSANGVEITDALPTGTTLVSASATQGSVTGTVWSVGSLPTTGFATLTIVATIDAGTAGTTLVNTAALSASTETDTNPGNDSATAAVTVRAVDIAVTKTVNSPAAQVGDTVTFTISATNAGPDAATSVVISDLLPAGLTYTSGSPTQGGYLAGTGTWTVGTIAAGATATLTMTATVGAGTPGTTLTNTATLVSVTETDTDSVNDSDSASIPIPAVDIAVTKTVNEPTANPGDPLTYTITVINNGPDTAAGIEVTDVLPAGVTAASSSTSQGSLSGSVWVVGSLGASVSATLTYNVTVDAGTAGSTITNTATVTDIAQDDTNPSNDSASASTSVNAVDLMVTKVADSSSANPGDTVTYTVTVTNGGPDTATGVTITDTLPAGVSLATATPTQGTYVGSTWTIGTLGSGSSATLTLLTTVDAGAEGSTITNLAALAAVVETDTDPSNDSDTAVFNVPAIDLFVTKVADNVAANPGETVTYTVTIGNAGPSGSTNVLVNDALPAGLTLVSASASQGSYTAPTWTVGTVGNGGTATLSLVATVDAGTAGTTITNTATIAGSDEIDTDPSNDSASTDVAVPAVNLIVAKSVNDTSPNPGETVTYTVQVTNGGPDTATGVALTDTLPPGVTLVSATTTQGSYTAPVWTVGSLLAGSTVTLTIVADVDAGTEGSTIVNTAAVFAVNETDTNPTNDSASVSINVPAVDLSITKIVDATTANPGDTVTFTITAANAGPDTATGVQVSDALPLGMTLVSVTPSLGSYVGSTWSVGALASGATETLVIVATVGAGTAGTSIINTASASGVNETDTDPATNSDSATVTVNAVDIGVSKTVDDATPNVGDTITYLVTVTNNGPNTATGVTISESLPTGLTLVSASASQGTVAGSLWTVGSLVLGASASLTIVATVDAGTGSNTMTNTASLSGIIEEDTNPSNDDASASLTPQCADLSIDKVVDIANAAPGDTVTFTVTLANDGPDTGTGIIVNDVLPAGLTPVSATPSIGTWTAPQWSIPSFPSAATATLVVVATIDSGLWNQTFTNTATVTASDQEDPDPGNDSDDAIVTTAPSADLAITKSVDNASPDAGDTITYTLTVANNGPDDEPAVVVTDSLPAGVTYVSNNASVGVYDDTTGVWSAGLLPNAATETLTILAVVGSGFGRITITNVASVSGTLVDTEPANNMATVEITPTLVDVEIMKTAPGTARAGSVLDYEIVVSNNGPDTATGVSVSDVLPGGITYIGSAASIGSYDPGTGVWSVGNLSSAATATLTINVSMNTGSTGDVVNSASVSVSGPEDADPGNDSSTVTTTVLVPPVANDDVAATPFETPVVVPILGNDTDADGMIDPTTATVTIGPANGAVTVDPVTGALTYSPDVGFSGADIFEYSVCDNDGLCDTASVFVTIDPENDAPYPFIRDGDGDPSPVGLITYTIAVGETPDPLPLIDPNDDNIISLVITDGELPPGLSINPDGSFSGAASTIGTYTVQIEICDDGFPQRCSLFLVTIRVGETLPYTGLEVVGFIRLGLMFILGGAILVLLAWKREDEEGRDGNAPMVS